MCCSNVVGVGGRAAGLNSSGLRGFSDPTQISKIDMLGERNWKASTESPAGGGRSAWTTVFAVVSKPGFGTQAPGTQGCTLGLRNFAMNPEP